MSTAAITMDVAPVPRMLWAQSRSILIGRLRTPAFSVLSLGLPTMFYALFNAIFGKQIAYGGTTGGEYLALAYGVYAVGNVMVFNFGIGLANERGRKLDLLQRAMPIPPAIGVLAQVLTSMVFGLLALAILYAYAYLVGGVHVGLGTWLDMTWRPMVGALPLLALGMAIGYGVGANTAPAVVNVVYLPMTFVAGVFIPFSQLPSTVQQIGKLLPLYHDVQLGFGVIPGLPNESAGTALLWLAGWTIALLVLAMRLYRIDESKKFS